MLSLPLKLHLCTSMASSLRAISPQVQPLGCCGTPHVTSSWYPPPTTPSGGKIINSPQDLRTTSGFQVHPTTRDGSQPQGDYEHNYLLCWHRGTETIAGSFMRPFHPALGKWTFPPISRLPGAHVGQVKGNPCNEVRFKCQQEDDRGRRGWVS